MTINEAKSRLVTWANAQIGYREGDNNWNKYAENEDVRKLYGWKPQNQPWCDSFVDAGFCTCFGLELASALTYQPVGKGSAACRYSAGFYSAHEAFYQSPEIGDQIFFFVGGGINHTGIVVEVSGGVVYTVEGNTSDMVARRAYGTGSNVIAGYGRPNWSAVIGADVPADDPKETTPATPTINPATLPCFVKLPLLKRGDGGKGNSLEGYVKALQGLLLVWGYKLPKWGADGDFGSETETAVLNFQHDHGLSEDGVVGNDTYKVLHGG